MRKKDEPLCVLKEIRVVEIQEVDHVATGAKMRALRENAGVSQTEMSRRLEMNLGQLSQMESGKRQWDEAKAARYVGALRGAKAT